MVNLKVEQGLLMLNTMYKEVPWSSSVHGWVQSVSVEIKHSCIINSAAKTFYFPSSFDRYLWLLENINLLLQGWDITFIDATENLKNVSWSCSWRRTGCQCCYLRNVALENCIQKSQSCINVSHLCAHLGYWIDL